MASHEKWFMTSKLSEFSYLPQRSGGSQYLLFKGDRPKGGTITTSVNRQADKPKFNK